MGSVYRNGEIMIEPKEIVEYMNSLVALDRKAIGELLLTLRCCDEQLAQNPASRDETIGLLGILDGLCGHGANRGEFIGADFDGKGELQGFCVVTENGVVA